MIKSLFIIVLFILVRTQPANAQVKIDFDCEPFAGQQIKIHLVDVLQDNEEPVETIELSNTGKILNEEEIEISEGLYIIEFPHQIKIPAAFDAGESVKITFNGIEIKINNSRANDLFTQFENERKKHFNKNVKPIRTKAENADKQQDTAMAAELSRQEQKAYNNHKNHLITWGYENMQGSIAALEVMKRRRSGDRLKELEYLIKSVQSKYPENEQVKAALEEVKVLQNTLPGAKAPDFTSIDQDGKKKNLQKLAGKKGTLIEFWASWCMPCRRMTPELNQIIEDYKSRGIEFILISLDKKEEAWRAAVTKDKMKGTHLCDFSGYRSEPAKKYGITSIPAGFLLDADGRIVGKDLKGDELRIKLEELVR